MELQNETVNKWVNKKILQIIFKKIRMKGKFVTGKTFGKYKKRLDRKKKTHVNTAINKYITFIILPYKYCLEW